MYRSIAVIVVLFCSVGRSGEIPDRLEPAVEKARQLQEQQLEKLKQLQERLETSLSMARSDGQRRQEISRKIEQVKKQIDAIKSGVVPAISLNCFDLRVGEIGRLDAKELEVVNVLGPEKMLVVPIKTVTQLYSVGLRMRQTFRDEVGEPLIVYGWSTKGIVDGKKFKPSGWIEVTGTERYVSVAGTVKTVFVIKAFDVDALRANLRTVAAETAREAEKKAWEKAWAEDKRIWTDKTGKFRVEAMYAGYKPGKVILQKADKSTIEVELKRLSDEDRLFAVRTARERGDLKGRD